MSHFLLPVMMTKVPNYIRYVLLIWCLSLQILHLPYYKLIPAFLIDLNYLEKLYLPCFLEDQTKRKKSLLTYTRPILRVLQYFNISLSGFLKLVTTFFSIENYGFFWCCILIFLRIFSLFKGCTLIGSLHAFCTGGSLRIIFLLESFGHGKECV